MRYDIAIHKTLIRPAATVLGDEHVAGVHHRDTLKRLVAALKPPDDKIDLILAALLIARLDNEELDVAAYEGEVSRLAGEVKRTLKDDAAPRDKLAALDRYLFDKAWGDAA